MVVEILLWLAWLAIGYFIGLLTSEPALKWLFRERKRPVPKKQKILRLVRR